MTLQEALDFIADKMMEFRKPCEGGSLYGGMEIICPIANPQAFENKSEEWKLRTSTCCHGKGYVPRPAHELADVLWKAGLNVQIRYWVDTQNCDATVWDYASDRSIEGWASHPTDANAALALATVDALGGLP